MSICFCASGCALNLMADPGVFGDDCSCWCHKPKQDPGCLCRRGDEGAFCPVHNNCTVSPFPLGGAS